MRGERLTYAEMVARAESRAAGLRALGIRPGDKVAVEVPSNTPTEAAGCLT